VVGFKDGRVEIRSPGEHKPSLVLPGFGSNFHFARFSRDGNYLAAKYHGEKPSDNPGLRVWDLRSRVARDRSGIRRGHSWPRARLRLHVRAVRVRHP
jgi:hypothetical protein